MTSDCLAPPRAYRGVLVWGLYCIRQQVGKSRATAKSWSDQQTGKVTVIQQDGSEEGSCKHKGTEEGVKSAKTSF